MLVIINFNNETPIPLLVKKNLLAKNDLHAMKRIHIGPRVVARWLPERVLKLKNSVLVKRPTTLLKNGKNKIVLKCFLGQFECFKHLFFLVENCPILPPTPP